MKRVKRNILLNPGPATTTDTVKYAQVVADICPREKEFCEIMQYIATELTNLVADTNQYTTVLFGGSGTAAVESILSSVTNDGVTLIINNGAYGKRMCEIAEAYQLEWIEYTSPLTQAINLDDLKVFIEQSNQPISYLAVVHNETTTGLLNNIRVIGELCKEYEINMIVDAMSSFGAVPISMKKMNITYLAASSNKNLQAMPGVSFVIAAKSELERGATSRPKNYYLNLFSQYKYSLETTQMRFTPPVQTCYSLKQAILELKNEGVQERYSRYQKLWKTLINGLCELGLTHLVDIREHSMLVTAILEPNCEAYQFKDMHEFLLRCGITIYPGKLNELKSFRVANIGDLTKDDIDLFLKGMKQYLTSIGYDSQTGSEIDERYK